MRVQSIARSELSIDQNSVARRSGTPISKDGVQMQNESSPWRSRQIELHLKGFRRRIRVDLNPIMLHGAATNDGIKRARLVGGPVPFGRTLANFVEDRMSGFAVLGKLGERTVLGSNAEDIDGPCLCGDGFKEIQLRRSKMERDLLEHQESPPFYDRI